MNAAPTTAPPRLHPTLRTLLRGACEEGSSLYQLAGHSDVLQLIWSLVQREWALQSMKENSDCVAFAHVDNICFPKYSGRSANMMPFLLDDLTTLPEELRDAYGDLIKTCRRTLSRVASEDTRVAYLTVQESVVTHGEAQRRPGLHTEGFSYLPCETSGQRVLQHPYWHAWGFGHVLRPGHFSGGIFMASNVANSTNVYNAFVPDALVGAGGDIEHLRPILTQWLPEPPAPRANTGKERGHVPYAARGEAHLRDMFDRDRVRCPLHPHTPTPIPALDVLTLQLPLLPVTCSHSNSHYCPWHAHTPTPITARGILTLQLPCPHAPPPLPHPPPTTSSPRATYARSAAQSASKPTSSFG